MWSKNEHGRLQRTNSDRVMLSKRLPIVTVETNGFVGDFRLVFVRRRLYVVCRGVPGRFYYVRRKFRNDAPGRGQRGTFQPITKVTIVTLPQLPYRALIYIYVPFLPLG